MQAAHEQDRVWTEQQVVHRLFTIRWTRGATYTRLHGQLQDDANTRREMDAWGKALQEIIPQTGGPYVSLLDTTGLSEIPRSLWLDVARLVHQLPRQAERRAVMTAEGWVGDNQAETGQLVTAGHIRAFKPGEIDEMIRWAAQAGTIPAAYLRAFVL